MTLKRQLYVFFYRHMQLHMQMERCILYVCIHLSPKPILKSYLLDDTLHCHYYPPFLFFLSCKTWLS